jgi:two-component system, sensor histidine kinase and response regulator
MAAERILVVDDSPTQLEAARVLLEQQGYAVSTARSGEEALEKVAGTTFDLVLSDVVMPGISGYDLCSRIKRGMDEPPALVLLTTLADPRDIVRGVECGADNYITKPYTPDHLLGRLQHVFANRELRRSAQPDEPSRISFLGETYTITSDPPQILALLLSSFEELIRTNEELQKSKQQVAEAHARELRREQEARARAEADTRRMELLKQRAEAATRVRDDVLATVSHDLKNPVGTIYTSASLLLDMPLPPDAQQRQLEIIRRTAERMDRLIQDLLDVSRMEAGRFTIESAPESARALILEAKELHGTIAAAQQITLAHEFPGDDVLVNADRERVQRVFSNLIGNALKFTPPGGSVTVRAERGESEITFAVVDTGTGISPENLPRIFDQFWHGGEGGGSGLGLAIARGIVEAHGGRIWAESTSGGSTFLFTLPLAGNRGGSVPQD